MTWLLKIEFEDKAALDEFTETSDWDSLGNRLLDIEFEELEED